MAIQRELKKKLAQFPEAGRQLATQLMTAPTFAGVVSSEQAGLLANQMGISIEALMDALVPIARCYANPPISNYHVGSVVLGKSGALYFGGNLEFPGFGLNMTVHGEQAAVVNARHHGETGLAALAVNGTPCGHCRQFLAEINNPHLAIIYSDDPSRALSKVLPNAFMPAALGNKHGLLDPIETPVLDFEGDDVLIKTAVKSAQQSYAPYSKNWAGLAVKLRNGQIISGPYLENAAFNPSLAPLQNVLVIMRMQKRPWETIEDAVLVEQKASLSSQKQISRALLASLCGVELRYLSL